tara:strand:- start:626 stop:1186 length:561 start_codon:yes stop_codon:yes gene_type:complete
MIKRIFDVIFTLCIILILSPIYFLIIFILYITDTSVFFYSKRIGQNGEIYTMPKFKTMKDNSPDLATDVIKNPAIYYTKFGKFLRRFSLDELPQFFTILTGKMSIVGPRPALFNQYSLIEKRKRLGIYSLKPGITGLAQISGRDNLTEDQKISYDKAYLENNNILTDIKIVIKTPLKVIKGADVRT